MRIFKVFSALGVLAWTWSIVWFVRLARGLEHVDRQEIPVLVVCGLLGGVAAWSVVRWVARREAALRDQ
jgi:hypothetical protein